MPEKPQSHRGAEEVSRDEREGSEGAEEEGTDVKRSDFSHYDSKPKISLRLGGSVAY